MNPLAAMPPLDPLACARLLPAAAAVTVCAPLLGIGWAQLAGARFNTRLAAGWSLAAALAAAVTLAWAWRCGPGQPVLLGPQLAGGSLVHLDGLTAIMLPMVVIVLLAIVLVAPRRAVTVGGITRLLAGAALTTATMTTSHPVALVVLWVASLVPTWLSTRATPGGRPTARVYALMMSIGCVVFAIGVGLMAIDPPWANGAGVPGATGGWLVALAIMIRKGIVPFHSWYPALFAAAPMSAALAGTMPQVASYAAVRLLVGHGDGVGAELVVLSQAALVTAAYG
ncbi:MAG: proton-conducting transporter membrane subunit, partial [Planctomycetota bacterium]